MTKMAYKLYKNDNHIGYLIGSFHAHINPEDYKKFQQILNIYLAEVGTLYLEAQLPHHTTLSLGIEKAVLQAAEQFPTLLVRYFEDLAFQQAMLSCSVWYGERIITLPWFKYQTLKSYPRIFKFLSVVSAQFIMWYNVIYNFVKGQAHTRAVQKFNVDQQAIVTTMFEAYMRGEAQALPDEDNARYLMKERDHAFVGKIIDHINDYSNQKTLYIMGVAHFPRPDGVVNLLQKQGIILEPIDSFC